jgi:peptide/nickel transport system permease protein
MVRLKRSESLRYFLYAAKKSPSLSIGLAIVLFLVILYIAAPYVAPYPEDAGKVIKFEERFQPPSLKHLFGTDEFGRDVFSRVIIGTRITLSIAFLALLIILAVGVPMGLFIGYAGGLKNMIMMRITDIFLSIPSLVLALVISALLARSLNNLVYALALTWWPWYVRLINGEVLSIKEELYIEAAKSIGASTLYIIFKEILPNIIFIIAARATLDLGYIILTAATLGFLGLGVSSPTPEWGTMIAEGRLFLPTVWWTVIFPAIFIFIAVIGFYLLSGGVMEAFYGRR